MGREDEGGGWYRCLLVDLSFVSDDMSTVVPGTEFVACRISMNGQLYFVLMTALTSLMQNSTAISMEIFPNRILSRIPRLIVLGTTIAALRTSSHIYL